MVRSNTLEGVMAFVPGFEYDIFISYAHTDNLTSKPDEIGWVEQFHKDLRVGLARCIGRTDKVKIWRDEKLDGSELFDQVIKNRINQSAIFLALNSPGYRISDYCQQELQWFHQKAQTEKAGLHVGERMRIFNVLLYNIPYDQWPTEFGRTTGFPFHVAKSEEDLGAPLDIQGKDFETRMRALVDAIVQLLNLGVSPCLR
jgi:TIR domain